MNRQQAEAVAVALGGRAWHGGGGIWLVRFDLPGGRLVVVSGEAVCEYEGEEAFYGGRASATVELCAAEACGDSN
jgi:hypothetical protein